MPAANDPRELSTMLAARRAPGADRVAIDAAIQARFGATQALDRWIGGHRRTGTIAASIHPDRPKETP